MTLAQQIQALRKEKGLSQEELGEKLGVARQSVSKWESGATIPELDKLIAMSRLFGVSVGSILGLEETGEPDRELTERELKALEAIAQRLTPPAAEPQKRKRWPLVVAAVAVIGTGLFLMSRINALENQLGGLQYNLSNVQNTVSREIGSISAQVRDQVRDILEEQDSVTAGKDYGVTGMDLKEGTVTFTLTATPREYREGMTAVFSASSADFQGVEAPGALETGQTFTGSLTCPLADDITLSVGFTEGDTTVNQELGREPYLLSDTQLYFYGNLGWTMTGRGSDKAAITRLNARLEAVSDGRFYADGGWQELTLTTAQLRLWKNDQVIWSDDPVKEWKDAVWMEVNIPVEDLTVETGDRLILSVYYMDTAGRQGEAWLSGFEAEPDGGLVALQEEDSGPVPWEGSV